VGLGNDLLVGVGAIGLVAYREAAHLDEQFRALSQRLTESASKVQDQLRQHEWGQKLLDPKNFQAPPAESAEMFGRFTRFFSSTLGGVVDAVIILFIGI